MLTDDQMTSWICCQLGARENYSIPRALHQAGRRTYLITDVWSSFPGFAGRISGLKRFVGRRAADFPREFVRAATIEAVAYRAAQRLKQEKGWARTHARNLWFENVASQRIRQIASSDRDLGNKVILFSYAFASLGCIEVAKGLGWKTIVGAIDPGPAEQRIVAAEVARYPELALRWDPPPPAYWDRWKHELELADRIVVNSRWSQRGLVSAGLDTNKISVVPLAYEASEDALRYERQGATTFNHSRPLRVLFLGQVILRKGVAAILEAARILANAPVEFQFVGPIGINIPQELLRKSNLKWVGPVPRADVASHFRTADVFLFPTLSDGYGLTQLEAFSWGLPMIVSEYCGEVVSNGKDGIVLREVSGPAIAEAIQEILARPESLAEFSREIVRKPYGLGYLSKNLAAIEALT